MGNEQGSPYLQQKQQQSSSNSGTSSPYDFESLIVIRGERKTGKSTLVSRMKGQNFNPTYSPTPGLEVFQFPWKLNSSHCNNVMISIWDVVEHSIPQKVESENSTPLPDAQSIDTLKRANGLVIMIDYRNDRSIELADRLISEAPEECQVVVFSNFYGEESVPPTIPKKLRNHVGRFSFILGNLRTNLGLVALSKWLQLPLLSAKRKMFADLFRATDNDLHQLEDEFVENSKNFLQRNSALAQIPRGNPNMNYYANVGASVSNEQAVRKSNVSPSSSQASQPTKLERPSVFAEPIQPRKRKPMPFCNNTGGSFDGEEKKEDPDDNDDDFWSDNENDESNDSFAPHAQSKKDNLRPNPMVQAAAPKKTMKQIIEENTIKPENTDQKIDNINPVNNSNNNQKLRKKKKKVNHMNTQNKELINDHCQSSSSEGENDQDQLIKQQQKQEIINSNVNENEVVTQNKPKAIFTTTLVLEEEDEEDQVENAASPQTNTIFNQPAVVNENQTTNKKVENKNDNEDEFWSDNDNDDNIETKAQDLQLNIQENDEDEALTKPNPLVQKAKPRSNPYQNIIPKTQNETEKNPIDTSSSQISNNEPKEETEKININTSQINNNNEQKEETEKIITNIQQINNKEEQKNEKEEQKQNSSQTVTKPSTTSNNDDDDFWNFEPVSNQKVVSEAIKKKKLMKQKVAHNESKQKERPLVIPKSQVAQRTITVQQNKLSYDQQQKQQQLIQQQNPVIPTTDLFSDLNESKNDEFFQAAKPTTNILIKSSQKTDQSVTKTVRKRKRVVKSSGGNSANKNDQTPSSGYDSI